MESSASLKMSERACNKVALMLKVFANALVNVFELNESFREAFFEFKAVEDVFEFFIDGVKNFLFSHVDVFANGNETERVTRTTLTLFKETEVRYVAFAADAESFVVPFSCRSCDFRKTYTTNWRSDVGENCDEVQGHRY